MPERPSRERLQPLDMVALARLAEMRFMLADQVGDRFMPDRDRRTVQRRVKLWEDLGLIRRIQFWKRASAASRGPVALYVTDACVEMLKAFPSRDGLLLAENFDSKGPVVEDDAAHYPRHDVRVAGWVNRFEMLAGRLATEIRGPRSAFLRPPRPRDRRDARPAIGPADLNAAGRGYEVLDLTDGYGKPAETFRKIEPDAGVLVTTRHGDNVRRIDVLVELDRTGEPFKNARKFARYDQLITGWAEAHPRYGRFGEGPMAVFVCRDGSQAREFAKVADDVVTGARARTGVPRRDWEYPGRRRMFFVAEGDVHQGMLDSLRLESLPPAVRNADKPKGGAGSTPSASSSSRRRCSRGAMAADECETMWRPRRSVRCS